MVEKIVTEITDLLEGKNLHQSELIKYAYRGAHSCTDWIERLVKQGVFARRTDGLSYLIWFTDKYKETKTREEREQLVKDFIFPDSGGRQKHIVGENIMRLRIVNDEIIEKISHELAEKKYSVMSSNQDVELIIQWAEGEEIELEHIHFPLNTELYGKLSTKIIFYFKEQFNYVIKYIYKEIVDVCEKKVRKINEKEIHKDELNAWLDEVNHPWASPQSLGVLTNKQKGSLSHWPRKENSDERFKKYNKILGQIVKSVADLISDQDLKEDFLEYYHKINEGNNKKL